MVFLNSCELFWYLNEVIDKKMEEKPPFDIDVNI